MLTPDVLRRVDAAVDAACAAGGGGEGAAASEEVLRERLDPEGREGLLEKATLKLALLVAKRRAAAPAAAASRADAPIATTAAALWPDVATRTDEIYEAAEAAQDSFEALVDALRAAEPGVEVKLGGLKDPIRVHEKAWDDYAADEAPEACVLDVLRARLVVPRAWRARLTDAVAWLQAVRGGGAALEVLKNKFAALDPAHLAPPRQRAAHDDRRRHQLCRWQLHDAETLRRNDESHCHDHYNFFRAMLRDQYQRELDEMLEGAMRTFAEVSKNPVLLSMLVVLSGNRRLPRDRYNLYREAMGAVLEDALADVGAAAAARGVLRAVACANHLRGDGDGVRFFTTADARRRRRRPRA